MAILGPALVISNKPKTTKIVSGVSNNGVIPATPTTGQLWPRPIKQ